eukprot:scaffold96802_cov27-Tisochrysis_lutea.AAC.1
MHMRFAMYRYCGTEYRVVEIESLLHLHVERGISAHRESLAPPRLVSRIGAIALGRNNENGGMSVLIPRPPLRIQNKAKAVEASSLVTRLETGLSDANARGWRSVRARIRGPRPRRRARSCVLDCLLWLTWLNRGKDGRTRRKTESSIHPSRTPSDPSPAPTSEIESSVCRGVIVPNLLIGCFLLLLFCHIYVTQTSRATATTDPEKIGQKILEFMVEGSPKGCPRRSSCGVLGGAGAAGCMDGPTDCGECDSTGGDEGGRTGCKARTPGCGGLRGAEEVGNCGEDGGGSDGSCNVGGGRLGEGLCG